MHWAFGSRHYGPCAYEASLTPWLAYVGYGRFGGAIAHPAQTLHCRAEAFYRSVPAWEWPQGKDESSAVTGVELDGQVEPLVLVISHSHTA